MKKIILRNGIEWEVIGRSGKTMRVQHKCSRWIPVIHAKTISFKSKSVMLVSQIKETEWKSKQ